jgi:penicillin-binding protein 1A
MPPLLAFALGAKETTPLRLVTAYGMIDNGGHRISPSIIDRVQDRDGKTIWRADKRDCTQCQNLGWTVAMMPPDIPDTREQIEDPRTTYQMVSMLEGVVQRGTAARLHDVGVPLAGKTGTTTESKDAWFVGFTPDLVCGVYVGFDDPKPLGSHETGASVAVPIFKEFITEAIKGKPARPFPVPPGLRMVRINPETGALASVEDKVSIWEAYVPGTEPQEGQERPVLDGSVTGSASQGAAAVMTPAATAPVPTATESAPEIGGTPGMPAAEPPKPSTPAAPATTGTGGLY